MAVERLVEQLKRGLDAPICLTWELTYACNLACVHCLSSSGRRDPRELTTAEAKAVLDELHDLQVFYINIGGGEPMIRRDFFELVEYAIGRDVGVKFSTNGALHRRRRGRAGWRRWTTSTSRSPSTASTRGDQRRRARRGLATPWRRRAMDHLAAADFGPFKISVVVTRHNVDQLDELRGAGRRATAPQLRVTRLRPSGRGADTWHDLHPTNDQQRRLYHWLLATARTCSPATRSSTSTRSGEPLPGLNMCGAGRVVCLIDPIGDVYACPFVIHDEFKAGSVRDDGRLRRGVAQSRAVPSSCASRSRPAPARRAAATTPARAGAWRPSSSPACRSTAPTPSACNGHGEAALLAATARRATPCPGVGHSKPGAATRVALGREAGVVAGTSVSLLEPLRLGGARRRRNRVRVRAARDQPRATVGRSAERHVAYYRRRAAGGAGVIVIEEASVHASDWPYERCAARRRVRCRAGATSPTPCTARHGRAGRRGARPRRRPGLDRRTASAAVGAVAGARGQQPRGAEVDGGRRHRRGRRRLRAPRPGSRWRAGCDGVEVNAGQHSPRPPVPLGPHQPARRRVGHRPAAVRPRGARCAVVAAVARGPPRCVGLRLSCDELAPVGGASTPEIGAPTSRVELAAAGRLPRRRARLDLHGRSATRPDVPRAAGLQPRAVPRGPGGGPAQGSEIPSCSQGSVVDLGQAEWALGDGVCDRGRDDPGADRRPRPRRASWPRARRAGSGRASSATSCARCATPATRSSAASVEPSAGHEVDASPVPDGRVRAGSAASCARRSSWAADRPGSRRLGSRRPRGSPGAAGRRPRRTEAAAVGSRRAARAAGRAVRRGRSPSPGWTPSAAGSASPSRRASRSTAADVAAPATAVRVVLAHRRPSRCARDRRRSGALDVRGTDAATARAALELARRRCEPPRGLGPDRRADRGGGRRGARRRSGSSTSSRPDNIVGNELARTGDLAPANVRLQQAGVRIERRSIVRAVRSDGVASTTPRSDVAGRASRSRTGSRGERRPIDARLVVDAGLPRRRTSRSGAREPDAPRGAGDCVAPRTVHEAILDGSPRRRSSSRRLRPIDASASSGRRCGSARSRCQPHRVQRAPHELRRGRPADRAARRLLRERGPRAARV